MNYDTAQYFVGIRRALQGLTVHAFQPTVTATVTLTDAKAGLYSIAVTRVSRSMVMVLACLPHLKISFGTTYLWEQCRICMPEHAWLLQSVLVNIEFELPVHASAAR